MKFPFFLALAGAALIMPLGHASGPNPYPLTTCIVSGEKLGEMGNPVTIEYQGRQIGFCCESCVKKFRKDPSKYLSKLPPAKQ
jgi:YHS domain-containing protein